jgi:zinc finger CCCH domain-containing protein 13
VYNLLIFIKISNVKNDEGSDDNESNGSIEIITEGELKEPDNEGHDGNDISSQNTNMGWNDQNVGDSFSGYGFNGNQGTFSGMDWSQAIGFNPMMQMQMQSNMMNGNWNFQNMMGSFATNRRNRRHPNFRNTGMNPTEMAQGMFGGFGLQGMEMNNGMMGMDFNSTFGWNNGQQMSNDFGHGNYYAGGGGYNQSHQGRYFQQHPKNNYQNRFHGQDSFQNRRASGQSAVAQSTIQGDTSHRDMQPLTDSTQNVAGHASKDDDQPKDAENSAAQNSPDDQTVETTLNNQPTESIGNTDANNAVAGARPDSNHDLTMHDQSTNQDSLQNVQFDPKFQGGHLNGDYNQNAYHNFNQGHQQNSGYEFPYYRGRGRGGGFGRGGFRGRGGFYQNQDNYQVVTPVQPLGQGVEGAPTGPKAMREGNTGFRGRSFNSGRGGHQHSNSTATDTQSVTQAEKPSVPVAPIEPESGSRVASRRESEPPRSRSKTRSVSPRAARSRSPSRSRSRDRRKHRSKRHRSRSASSERYDYDQDYHREKRHHKSKSRRKYEEEYSEREGDDREKQTRSRDYSRERSVETERSKYRSNKREKEREKHRSSRSTREQSRDRRKDRHRSKSPQRDEIVDLQVNGHGEDGSKRYRSEKYREREKDGRSRDYDRQKERRGHDKERDKREREKRSSRRDGRSPSVELVDSNRRGSRISSRRDHDGHEKDTENTRNNHQDRRPSQVIPDPSELKIQGQSSLHSHQTPTSITKPPPTGPKALLDKLARAAHQHTHTPTGPSSSARRARNTAQSPPATATVSPPPAPRPKSSTTATNGSSSHPSGPTTDPHTLEREARNRERMLKEEQRRRQLSGSSAANESHPREQHLRKRSFADALGVEGAPTEPRGERDAQRRRKSGGRVSGRVMSVKYEDEENDEARARRVESEREALRWS